MQGLILYPSCFKKGIKQIKFRSCKQNKLTQDFNSNQKKRFFVLSSNSELGYTKLELSLEDKQKLQSCVKFVKEIQTNALSGNIKLLQKKNSTEQREFLKGTGLRICLWMLQLSQQKETDNLMKFTVTYHQQLRPNPCLPSLTHLFPLSRLS